MSEISLKSITGITSITTPAGVDNQLTLHNNNTTEAVKVDTAGNVHVNNQLSIAGVSTFSEDVKFVGATSGRDVQWDKSANYLRFKDNAFATFGNSDDLFIYHDGNHSQIRDVGTGHLILGGTHLYLTDGSGSEYFLQCIANNQVDLYFNNSIKLSTTSTGITASGTQHIFSSGTSGDCTVIIEADTDNNAEDENPKLVFKQDGGIEEAAIGMNLTNANNNSANEFFIASGINEGAIVLATTSTNGYTNAIERLRVTNTGNIQIPVDSGSSTVGRLQIGASQDLEIYHDSYNSIIEDSGSGNLLLKSNMIVGRSTADENLFKAIENAAVELYYNNVKKFETTSTGISVTGSTTSTVSSHNTAMLTLTANMGSNNNRSLIISSPVTDSTHNPFRFQTSNAFEFQVDGARTLFIHESGRIDLHHDGSTDAKLSTSSTGINISGDVELTSTDSGAAAAPTLKLQRDSSSPANGDILGQIMFGGKDSTPNDEQYAMVAGKIIQAGAGGEHGAIQITTRKQSAHVITANLTSTDYQLLNGTNLSVDGDITGNGNFQLTSADAGSAAAPELTLHRNSASPADSDYLGQIKFSGKHDAGSSVNYAKITGKILDASNGTEDGILEFMLRKAGSNNIAGRFRSDSLQLLNGTSLTVAGTSTFTGDVDISDSIVHTGDTDTKIRFPSNDQISFETAGVDRGRFDNDGNFLVGTTSHGNAGSGARKLVISGPSNVGLTINSTSTSGIYRDCNIYFGYGTSTNDMAKGQFTYSGNGDYFHMSVGNSSYTLAKSFRLNGDGTVRFDSTHTNANSMSLVIKSHKARALNDNNGIVFRDANDHTQAVINVTKMSTSDGSSDLVFRTSSGQVVNTLQGIPERMRIKSDGHVLPAVTNTQDLGSSSKRWRNVYTTDLQLSNEGKTNDVDGTWGNYTIQEGESDLFLINNRNGKKYKFNLTEVS